MSDEEDFASEIDEEEIDQYLDEDGSPLNTVIPELSLDEDEGNFHVVPDRVKSLESYIDFLSESISIGSISNCSTI